MRFPAMSIDAEMLLKTEGYEVKLSNSSLDLLKIAQAHDLPCYLVTDLSLLGLLKCVKKNLKKTNLEGLATFLRTSTFEYIQNMCGISIKFCTPYDPCLLPNERGSYSKRCDQLSQFLLTKINNLSNQSEGELKEEEQKESLLNLLDQIENIFSETEVKGGNEIDQNILTLILQEKVLYDLYLKNLKEEDSGANIQLQRQFFWIMLITAERILFV